MNRGLEEAAREEPQAVPTDEPPPGKLPAEEQSEMLFELRSGWLEDFEATALIPAPKPPTFAERLRRGVKVVEEGFDFWFRRVSSIASIATSRDDVQRVAPVCDEALSQNSRVVEVEAAQSKPALAAEPGPLAPTEPEEVLALRTAWLAEVEANPEKHAPKAVTWSMKIRHEFEPVTDELVYWVSCFADFVVRTMTPRARRRQRITGEQARRADAAGRFISAALVVTMCLGTVVYVANALRIFNPDHLARTWSGIEKVLDGSK